DLNLTKKTKITERVSIEFRADFLNAFNYVNFSVTSPNNASSTIGSLNSDNFGQITQAYRDVSTTNDPGGRMIQFALRLKFQIRADSLTAEDAAGTERTINADLSLRACGVLRG